MIELEKSISLKIEKVHIEDSFWSQYIQLVRDTVLPYQWEALNDSLPDTEPSHSVENFRIAAKMEHGKFHGEVFQDSDLAKWIEAVAYSLVHYPDLDKEALVDQMVELIAQAQQPDGYLNTYFTIERPDKKWKNLYECHEMYCAGHLMEAAVAYYQATGKKRFLEVMCRAADHIDNKFGPEPGKIQGYPGHQEIELALIRLYETTGNQKYLNLSKYFITQRGVLPNYFQVEWETVRNKCTFKTDFFVDAPDLMYNQSHEPVRKQDKAVGHAVRAMYMYSAIADLARITDSTELLALSRRLWSNVVNRQMYIIGAIGSTHIGEAFTFDYDLPNETAYAESCASVGLIFFAYRMLLLEPDGSYADIMERALYNVILSAMSIDGKHFFYVNPLEVWPEASNKNPDRYHVKPIRQKWFGCACCPPNITRLLTSLNQYIYSYNQHTIYVHLYIGGQASVCIDGEEIKLNQKSDYPWAGDIKITVNSTAKRPMRLAFRIPGWCSEWEIYVNGKEEQGEFFRGYLYIEKEWKEEEIICLKLSMPVELMQANPKVHADAGKVAIQRGPLIYCMEEADNGENIPGIRLDLQEPLSLGEEESLPTGTIVINGKGYRKLQDSWGDCLYRPYQKEEEQVTMKLVPYFLWGNREPGEMLVWLRI